MRRGELPAPDDDVLASRYERIDARLADAGLHWYEVSNWAANDASRCRHNLGYWDGGDWWGAGPGAHSHVGGVRWWNVKHPARYADRLSAGELPVGGSETLTAEDAHVERVMLTVRLRTGCRWRIWATVNAVPPSGWWRTDSRASKTPTWCSPIVGGCSPTPWSGTSWIDPGPIYSVGAAS